MEANKKRSTMNENKKLSSQSKWPNQFSELSTPGILSPGVS
jgi:hypothetical protein